MTYVGYAGELLANLRKIAAGKIEVVEFCKTCGADFPAGWRLLKEQAHRCRDPILGQVLRFQKLDYPLSTAQEVVDAGCTATIRKRIDAALRRAELPATIPVSPYIGNINLGGGNAEPSYPASSLAYHGRCTDDV